MKCGFFELDITPALGSTIPGGFAARYANEILNPLYCRAFVVKNDTSSLAMVSVDACGITLDITEQIRNRTAERIPMKPEQIMVMATHAHGAGPTLNWGEEVRTDACYLRNLIEKTSDAIVTAWQRAEESQLFVGKEDVFDISFIRVYQMKDGSLQTNPTMFGRSLNEIDKPCATIDPEILVLSVKQNDEFVGAVVNFATHPATIATNQITGDYISILSDEMKRLYGPRFVTVFITGACGNINHINPYDENSYADCYKAYRNVGKTLASKAATAMNNSVLMEKDTLDVQVASVDVRFRKPDVEQLIRAKKWFDSLGDGLAESTPSSSNYFDTFFALQTFLIMADKRTKRSVDLQLFRVGNCYIFGNPCQIFTEFGKKIKEACGEYCFISAFANDYCGYVPTPECMKPGVYEATLAPTSALEPAAGDLVTDKMIKMFHYLSETP